MLPAKKYRPPLVPSQGRLQPLKISKVTPKQTKRSTKNFSKDLNGNQSQKSISKRPISANNGKSIPLRSLSRNNSKQSVRSIRKIRSHSRQSTAEGQQIEHKFQLPPMTSKSWGIFQLTEKRVLAGFKMRRRREMASLTKIMNLVTILAILKEKKINPSQIALPVEDRASKINGTSAKLQKGLILSIQNLFYGMMLPSGNDAAYQIAIIGGAILKICDEQPQKINLTSQQIKSAITNEKQLVFRYLKEMNTKSRQLNMTRSKWSNPHGLSNRQNFTTIEDIFILSVHAMKIKEFREVVETKEYSCVAERHRNDNQNQHQNEQYESVIMSWENTNRMLWRGWSGLKTGITPNAGPCLAASTIKYIRGERRQFLVVLGDCMSMQKRWEQVDELVEWAMKEALFQQNS